MQSKGGGRNAYERLKNEVAMFVKEDELQDWQCS